MKRVGFTNAQSSTICSFLSALLLQVPVIFKAQLLPLLRQLPSFSFRPSLFPKLYPKTLLTCMFRHYCKLTSGSKILLTNFSISRSLYAPRNCQTPKSCCLYGLYLFIFAELEIKGEKFTILASSSWASHSDKPS